MIRIAILAGGGRLPLMIAESAAARGAGVHIVGIRGEADPEIARFPHTWVNWGQIGRMLTTLRREGDRQLVIAGDGKPAYIESLKRLVRASKAEDNVIFPGWLEGPEKFSALHSAELLVLTSHQENFGLCVIESLACGVPVLVSTQVNLSSQIAAARAGWVTPLTPEDLKVTLETAMQDDEERERRGLAGKQLVRDRFTWAVIVQELIALYRSTARKNMVVAHCA